MLVVWVWAVALCGGDRNEEIPATENEGGMLMRRACARTRNPRIFLLLEHRLQPTPSSFGGLPSWGLAAMHRPNVTWVYVAICNIQGARVA